MIFTFVDADVMISYGRCPKPEQIAQPGSPIDVRRKNRQLSTVPGLAKGQLWKLRHAYIYVVDLGKRAIEFKLMKSPEETFERTLTGEIDTLWGYLKQRGARLVNA